MSACSLERQQLLRAQVRQQDLDNCLGMEAVAGVGVPHRTKAQQGLWEITGASDDKGVLKRYCDTSDGHKRSLDVFVRFAPLE